MPSPALIQPKLGLTMYLSNSILYTGTKNNNDNLHYTEENKNSNHTDNTNQIDMFPNPCSLELRKQGLYFEVVLSFQKLSF